MKKILLWLFSFILAITLPLILLHSVYSKKIFLVKGSDYIVSTNLIWMELNQKLDKTKYYFEGWVVYPGIEQGYQVTDNKSIWLFDSETDYFYKLKAQQSSKRDSSISLKINDGLDYQSSIFSVNVDLKELDLENKCYDIYICYQHGGNNYLVDTNANIQYGELIK